VLAGAAFLMCAPLALTWGLLVIDATATSGWSYARQALDEVSGAGGCGVGDAVRVVAGATPLAEAGITRDALPPATVDAYPRAIRTAAVTPESSPVWGTYGVQQTGAVATPWFTVRGAPDRLRTEVLGGRGAARERVVRRAVEPSLDTVWWAYHRVVLSRRARAVRLVMSDGDPGDGSWLAVTAPFVPAYTSFTDATAHAAVWRNPDEVLAMPCRRVPWAPHGVFERFSWSLGPPLHVGDAIAAESPMIERGCLHPRVADGRFCAFELVQSGALGR
jgi:hypothetical protein